MAQLWDCNGKINHLRDHFFDAKQPWKSLKEGSNVMIRSSNGKFEPQEHQQMSFTSPQILHSKLSISMRAHYIQCVFF